MLAKLTGWIAGAAVLIVAGAVVTLWIAGRASVPDRNADLALSGLDAPVLVLFDARGIPTIRAEGMRDAYRTLGYLHARDRLWQMESMRRIGAGQMSEVIGGISLSYDILMRELNLYAQAEAQVAALPGEERADLQAYADGVNAFLDTRPDPLPMAFQIAFHTPAPWVPADSLIWGRLMSLQLSGDAFQEAHRARIVDILGVEKARQFLPRHDKTPASLNDGNRDGWIGAYDASNAWVLSGDRTATGAPILANDPHLGLGMPGQWYLARIETPDLTLVGATAPGVPLHILGHNGTIAWGLTTTHADTQDSVVLDQRHIDTADRRQEDIGIRFGADRAWTVVETEFGPIVSRFDGPATALSWTGYDRGLRTASALHRLNRVRSWPEFLAAMTLFDDPAQNVFYADITGVIGMKVVGRLPVRSVGADGWMPRSADRTGAAWTDRVMAQDLPGIVNPRSGFLYNANNRVITDAYPYRVSHAFQAGYRAERLLERLIDTADGHSLADSQSIQTDALSVAARRLVPLFAQATIATPQAAEAMALLSEWDFVMDRNAAAPAVYAALLNEAVRVLAEDDLGDAFQDAWRAEAGFVEAALTQAPGWCDDIRTTPVEDCAWAMGVALDRAVTRLTDRLGGSPADWRWGDLHVAPMRHVPLGFVPGLSVLSDRPIATSGGDHTLARGQSPGGGDEAAFNHVHGAGYRAIYDLGNLDNSLFALAGGQSGNPFDPHYGDLVEDWRDGRYFRIPGRVGDIPEDGGAVLRLHP